MKLSGGSSKHLEWACATEVMPGQVECGDRCVVHSHDRGILLGVIDGIGHGKEASKASKTAAEILTLHAGDSVIALVQRVHLHLRASRGVVMSLASLNFADHTLTWLGVGNVHASLLRLGKGSRPVSESVILRGGVVGYQLPPLKAEVIPVDIGDLLTFATDGIYDGYSFGINLEENPRQISEEIMRKHSKGNDDALVLIARYQGGGHEEKTH